MATTKNHNRMEIGAFLLIIISLSILYCSSPPKKNAFSPTPDNMLFKKPETLLSVERKYIFKSATELAIMIRKREATSVDIVKEFIANIKNNNYGKVPAVLKKDISGFIGNRLQAAVLREACFIVENGVADANDIDTVMVEGLGIRWAFNGPFSIADLGGLDIWEKVCQRLLPDLDNSIYRPSAISEKVEKGELGFKTGKGFYNHSESSENAHTNFREQRLSRLLQLKSDMNKGIDKHG